MQPAASNSFPAFHNANAFLMATTVMGKPTAKTDLTKQDAVNLLYTPNFIYISHCSKNIN